VIITIITSLTVGVTSIISINLTIPPLPVLTVSVTSTNCKCYQQLPVIAANARYAST